MHRSDAAGRPERVLGWLDEDRPAVPEDPPVPIRRDPAAPARGGQPTDPPRRSAWFGDGPSRPWVPPPGRT